MNPALALNILFTALDTAQKLAPLIESYRQSGQITEAQQQELYSKLEPLRTGAAFTAPHWQPAP
jgi:hypothetical protein